MKGRVDKRRVRLLREEGGARGPVVYWMSRDQRAQDNWALLQAQANALVRGVPLVVVFCLAERFMGAGLRQFSFMVDGLAETAGVLERKGVAFVLLRGAAGDVLPGYLQKVGASQLVVDFDPLRTKRAWLESIVVHTQLPVAEVDAHNIVPCWLASPKREYGAYTLRPKLNKQLGEFLVAFPEVVAHPHHWEHELVDWRRVRQTIPGDPGIPVVADAPAGSDAAHRVLERFIGERLANYPAASRDPVVAGLSELSPYLHFGQISAQRVALEVSQARVSAEGEAAFLEQLIVRRELSDNFCYYNPRYDALDSAPHWALETLENHKSDTREYVYEPGAFERARTHDELWNAAQLEMVRRGTMHGYMRMYWAKKILEWSATPADALATTIALNDRYQLDGRDPNGYVGAMWSIAGIHDRPWTERPIFGKIRYMNAAGCRRKFKVDRYIAAVCALTANPF